MRSLFPHIQIDVMRSLVPRWDGQGTQGQRHTAAHLHKHIYAHTNVRTPALSWLESYTHILWNEGAHSSHLAKCAHLESSSLEVKTYTEEYYSQENELLMSKGEMYVQGTGGHIPVWTPLTQTNEQKALSRDKREPKKLFYYYRRNKRGGGKSVCVSALFAHNFGCIQSLSTQLPACVPAHERSAWSPTCVNGSPVYTFLKKKKNTKSAMMSPWTHLEPTSVKKHYSSPPSPCLIFCSTSPSFTLLPLKFFTELLFFFIFPYFSTFPLSGPCLFFFLSPLPSLLILKNTSSFYSGKHHLIESPKCTTVCQKCQDVLIIINFV